MNFKQEITEAYMENFKKLHPNMTINELSIIKQVFLDGYETGMFDNEGKLILDSIKEVKE